MADVSRLRFRRLSGICKKMINLLNVTNFGVVNGESGRDYKKNSTISSQILNPVKVSKNFFQESLFDLDLFVTLIVDPTLICSKKFLLFFLLF